MHSQDDTREHLERLYSILDRVGSRCGMRTLAECHGRMEWPRRGIYFFFEPGEYRAAPNDTAMRVVRVGTHAVSTGSATTLWDRLKQHRGTGAPGERSRGGNHRGSIFRKHVGAALLRAGRYFGNGADTWGQGQSAAPEIAAREVPLECEVSTYIGRMPFVWIDADDEPGSTSIRASLERNSIGLLSAAAVMDPPSLGWLGLHAADAAIRSSALWNVRHVGSAYDPAFLGLLDCCATGRWNARTPVVVPARSQPAPSLEGRTVTSDLPRLEKSSVLALVSCTKLKVAGACRAADLYRPSPLFRGAWEYAGLVAANRMVLSAKYGLLRPDTLIEPYEQTLATAGRAERGRWAASVHAQLRGAPEYRDATTIVWLAGEAYRGELLPLVQRDGKNCEVPMLGLPQGKQLAWLNAMLSGRSVPASHPPVARVHDVEQREYSQGQRGQVIISNADDVRECAFERYVKPARARGANSVTIRVGDLHSALGYVGRVPAVVSALGSNKFLEQYGLRLLGRSGPGQSTTTTFTFGW